MNEVVSSEDKRSYNLGVSGFIDQKKFENGGCQTPKFEGVIELFFDETHENENRKRGNFNKSGQELQNQQKFGKLSGVSGGPVQPHETEDKDCQKSQFDYLSDISAQSNA